MDHKNTSSQSNKHVLHLAIGLGIVSVVSCFAMAAFAQRPVDRMAISSPVQVTQQAAISTAR
ncbi:hypothetical protein FGU71_08775 [Erythrobacter insulae]|uniref:Uncharacterized protein n=1 Tax=Erythrobacter insulae TaxID=2584124 RepID=A0A547PCS0_9SPHN|nr:hypothetical protein [Erythrobacter insulae]TRD11938.1 hypothetical protein FGU71_08775 [Erythrobacter insulae]